MNDLDHPVRNDAVSQDLARVVRTSTLINHLADLCRKARHAGGSAFPSAVCWVLLDETGSHRDQVGFSGLEKLMRAVHERIRVQLGPADVTARFGLDAIAVVLDSHAGERDYASSGAALLRAISNQLIEVGDQMVAATVSIATQAVRETLRPSEMNLVAVARFAERLTEQGGNRSRIFDGDADGESEQPASLLGQLTKALRDNSLKVVFQPLLATSGPERERAQMLPRMMGSDGALIPAARFVPIAAKRGVLPVLDNWMIARAFRLMADYDGPDPSPQYFLNQSAALIDDPKFLEWLCSELKTLKPNQNSLVLEFNILEMKPRLREAAAVFETLREKGIGISLTGIDERVPEAVLLKHLPSDYLRMKADFARRLLSDETLAQRFEFFAHAAREAGRKLIVPMLEDAEEVSRIWQMEVDLIQGNFIQQPSERPSGIRSDA